MKKLIEVIKSWFKTVEPDQDPQKEEVMNIIDMPNTNHRPRSEAVDGIVIHSMGEYIGEKFAAEFLQSIGLSAHYLIKPDGTVVKSVNPDRVAYHAGESAWNGKNGLNKSFVGIEVLVKGIHTYDSFLKAIKDPDTYSDEQYKSCAELCTQLLKNYPDITPENIVRHSEVSGPDVRPKSPKKDPGEGFSMTRLKSKIYRNINATDNS